MSSISPISVQSVTTLTAATSPEGDARTISAAPSRPVPPVQPVADRTTRDDKQAVRAAAEQIESYLRHVNTNLEFRVDEAAGKVVVSVRERATGELIRQIPSEEALAIAASLDDYHVSGLLDRTT